jgi:hypothetical protein
MAEDKLPTEGNMAPLHTPPDFDAPAFPDLKDDPQVYRDPERGQHLIWVALALVIALIAWWGS